MHRKRAGGVLLALAAALLLAGCGSVKNQLASPTSTTRPDNGVAAKTAADILGDAQRALRSAPGVHVVGTLRSQGDAIDLDLRLGVGRGRGTVTVEGARLEMLAVNARTYIRGKEFWRKVGTGDGDARLGDQMANLIGERSLGAAVRPPRRQAPGGCSEGARRPTHLRRPGVRRR